MSATSFKAFIITEDIKRNQKSLKAHVERALKLKGIKITGSGRGGLQTRFPLPIPEKEWPKYFAAIGVKVSDYPGQSLSGKFFTYQLTATKNVGGATKGTTLPWVNNYTGKTAGGGQLFGNKELTPDTLGLAGKTLDTKKIITAVSKKLNDKYEKPIADSLIRLLKLSDTKKTAVPLNPNLTFKTTDLAKISADFGEIMAAVWAQNALRFRAAYFPTASNEPLIDFYGVRAGIQYPVSVKSGGGGKVTVQNIINSIENRAKTASRVDLSAEKSLGIFKIVNDNPMKQGMIKLHVFMNTKGIKKLSDITGIPVKQIDLDRLKSWVSDKDSTELKAKLQPFWDVLNMKLTDRIIEGPDKLRLIISPLGESIWKILNDSKEIKNSLTNVAKQVALIQVNVDTTNKQITFKSNFFRDADFEFGWAGYAGGNKLGFKMSLKK